MLEDDYIEFVDMPRLSEKVSKKSRRFEACNLDRFQGLWPDLTLFNSLLGTFPSWIQSLQLHSEMIEMSSVSSVSSLSPDILTYQMMISSSIKAAHWKHAIAFLGADQQDREMVSLNALLASLERLERWKSHVPKSVLSRLFSHTDLGLQNVLRS